MSELSDLDRRILDEIQARFPVTPAPYCELGERLGVPELDVLNAVLCMRETGVIRRVGAIFDSARIGYRSTLAAIAVPPERVDEVAELIGSYPNVTHNYLREDRYNVWFTLIAPSAERIAAILAEIEERTGISDILDLPAIRLFKIKVDLDMTGQRTSAGEVPTMTKPAETEAVTLTDDEKELARLLQEDLPTSERPFAELENELQERGVGEDEAWVLERTSAWVESGVIRRFGAAIRHHATGYVANAMGAWTCPEERVEEVGRIMASFKEVSHVYQRPSRPEWPPNLYTMIHGRSREECEDVARRIKEAAGLPEPRLLYSLKEFKKTSMRYFGEDEGLAR